jgi:lysyl-tRNA synthetase class 1
MHWFEELLSRIIKVKEKESIVFSAGLSVSGLQHVGRLRGEIIIPNALASALRQDGKKVVQYVVLYTQDSWKGKETQLARFEGYDGKRYINRRLIDVPDPHGCHDNWVAHYWCDFGDYLEQFANDVQVITTTELYEREEMREIVMDVLGKKELVRDIVNKYRGERKYGEDWVPFEPYCPECKTIGRARALDIAEEVSYECDNGHKGKSPIKLGKLNWRLEWPSIWKLLGVDIEPFGKDHATPGGSRDSCVEIAFTILGTEAPFGIPAHPDVLRYIYLRNDPMKRLVLDMSNLDVYYEAFDNAQRSYFSKSGDDEEDQERELDAFSWRLSARNGMEEEFALPFRHAALLAQVMPSSNGDEWIVKRLKDTGIIEKDLSIGEVEKLMVRLDRASRWVEFYSPRNRIRLLESLPGDIKKQLDSNDRKALETFGDLLLGIEWNEDSIKDTMVGLTKSGNLGVDTRRFFKVFYLVFLGSKAGPRAAPFLAVLEKGFVMERLEEAVKST